MRLCIVCGEKPARVNRRLCRTCETNKYMERQYDELKAKFSADDSVESLLMRDFMNYLDDSYGDQKREIAFRTKYVHEYVRSGMIPVHSHWTIDDVVAIEDFRTQLSVQKKTALYHFLQYIRTRYELEADVEELRIRAKVAEIPESFRYTVQTYLNVLATKRNNKQWTRYQLAFSFKYFFDFVVANHKLTDLREINRDCIGDFLHGLKSNGTSQKTMYNRYREISRFFKWAKQTHLVFSDPSEHIDVGYYWELTAPLTFQEQRELVKRWSSPDCDPREAVVGILALVYGLSADEIRNLELESFINEKTFHVDGRPTDITLADNLVPVLERYMLWREELCKGSQVRYLIVSRESYKTKRKLGQHLIWNILSLSGHSPRRLRATTLLDAASTGNIKLLESMGLAFDSTRPYMRAATPVLWMGKSP